MLVNVTRGLSLTTRNREVQNNGDGSLFSQVRNPRVDSLKLPVAPVCPGTTRQALGHSQLWLSRQH